MSRAPALQLIETEPERDPRQDPRIGDRLVKGREDREVVAWREHVCGRPARDRSHNLRGKPRPAGWDLLRYRTPSGCMGTMTLAAWQAWAARATVAELARDRAEDEPTAWLAQLGIVRVLPVEEEVSDDGCTTTEAKGWVAPWGEIRVTTTTTSTSTCGTVILDVQLRTGPLLSLQVDNYHGTLDAHEALWFVYGAMVVATRHPHELGAIAGAWATRTSPGVLVKQ